MADLTFTLNNKRVTLSVTAIEELMSNDLGTPIVVPSVDQTSTDSVKVINLLKVNRRFTIDGYLATGVNVSASSPVEQSSAKAKKQDIIEMIKTRSPCTLSYDGDSYTVTFEKQSIKEILRDDATEIDGEARYNCKFTMVEGSNLIE